MTPAEAIAHLLEEAQAGRMLFDAGGRRIDDGIDDGSAAIRAIADPLSYCPGCWYEQFPDVPFPSGFSSATCAGHAQP